MVRRVLAAIVCVLGVLLPLNAGAYYLETRGSVTEPLRFDDGTPVMYRIGNLSGTGNDAAEIEAINQAFLTWGTADCSTLSFEPGPRYEVVPPDPQHWVSTPMERYILVYFSDDAGLFETPIAGFFAFGHDGVGNLIGGTVVLNTRHHAWATDGDMTALDVQGTVTALLGRSLGITSTMVGNSTYPRYSAGDISKRMLGTDDLAAIAFLYPRDASCGMTAPEMTCAMDTPDCPPPVGMMMLPDGGIIPGVDGGGTLRDGGMMPGTDGGGTIFRDAGPGGGGDDEGCGCRVPGAAPSQAGRGMLALAAVAALGIVLRTRRRRRE